MWPPVYGNLWFSHQKASRDYSVLNFIAYLSASTPTQKYIHPKMRYTDKFKSYREIFHLVSHGKVNKWTKEKQFPCNPLALTTHRTYSSVSFWRILMLNAHTVHYVIISMQILRPFIIIAQLCIGAHRNASLLKCHSIEYKERKYKMESEHEPWRIEDSKPEKPYKDPWPNKDRVHCTVWFNQSVSFACDLLHLLVFELIILM